jgi:hypothetical protein
MVARLVKKYLVFIEPKDSITIWIVGIIHDTLHIQ